MIDKLIELNDKTDYRHIMYYANCETRLRKEGSKLLYFKIKKGEEWIKLLPGSIITIDSEHNINIIK